MEQLYFEAGHAEFVKVIDDDGADHLRCSCPIYLALPNDDRFIYANTGSDDVGVDLTNDEIEQLVNAVEAQATFIAQALNTNPDTVIASLAELELSKRTDTPTTTQ
jgi:hypothetical protein